MVFAGPPGNGGLSTGDNIVMRDNGCAVYALSDELFTVGGDVIRSDAKGYMVH